jgi:hypothetical protein
VFVNLHVVIWTFKLGRLTDAQLFMFWYFLVVIFFIFRPFQLAVVYLYSCICLLMRIWKNPFCSVTILRESGCQTHSATCGAGTGVFLLTKVLYSFINLHIISLGCLALFQYIFISPIEFPFQPSFFSLLFF